MTKICFTCDWGQDEPQLLFRLQKQTPGNTGRWNSLEAVIELRYADWVVVIGAVRDDVKRILNPERTIYILREPLQPQMADAVDAKYKLTYANSFCTAIWWCDRPFDELAHSKPPTKTKLATCVTTAKQGTEGHVLRYEFLKRLTAAHPGLIDVWGIDTEQMSKDFKNDYRGSLPYNGPNGRHGDKWPALAPYHYALAFENCARPRYFSEKILDAYLAWAMPFYWGAIDIADYFPPESYWPVDLKLPDVSAVLVRKVLQAWPQPTPRERDAVAYARNKILYEYNIWAMVEQVILTGKINIPGTWGAMQRREAS